MKEASERLGEAASVAGAEHAKAQRTRGDGGYFESEIYDRGTQYSLSQAEAWIMGAVVGILNFSTVRACMHVHEECFAFGFHHLANV